jgi:hypothetical protein
MQGLLLSDELDSLQGVYLLNRSNAAYARGHTFSIEMAKQARGWLIVSLVLFTLAFITAVTDFYTYVALNTRAVTAGGVVVNQYMVDGEGCPCYHVEYSFSASDDARYFREIAVNSDIYNSLPVDTAVTVTYLPDNPQISRIEGNSVPLVATAVAMGCALAAVVMLRRIATAHRLVRHGRLLPSSITGWDVQQKDDGEGGKYWVTHVFYWFDTPDGRPISAQKTVRCALRKPASGTLLAVLYVDYTLYEVL